MTKRKLEWCKHAFESELENTYDIEIQNGMICMHDNKVNNISECNLLDDIPNTPKKTKDQIAITLLFYMDVWIEEREKRSLKTFKLYWKVDLVTRL